MAPRGNPHPTGGKPDKLIRDALMLALNREAEGADGKKTKRLAIIADKLVALAMEGDVAAIKEIADRVDGKAIQGLQVSDPSGNSLVVQVVRFADSVKP